MTKKELHQIVESLEPLCQKSCKLLWEEPEIGGEEEESANYFRKILSEEGFVIVNEEKLPHALCGIWLGNSCNCNFRRI